MAMSGIPCSKCGFKLPEDAKYCPKCGQYAGKTVFEEIEINSDDLVRRIKEIIHEGNATKVIIEDEKGKTLLEIPVTVGLVGALFAPWLAALGAIAAIATNCKIIIEKRE
jgi:hypothetical protein